MSSRAGLASVLAIASVLALAAAGCGSQSASTRGMQAAATRICTRAADQGARIAPPAVPSQMPAFLRRGIAVLRPELANLRAVRAPSGQAGAYASALAALNRELTVLTGTLHDLDRGADPLTTVKTLQHRLAPVEADGDAAWRTLGVPACVSR